MAPRNVNNSITRRSLSLNLNFCPRIQLKISNIKPVNRHVQNVNPTGVPPNPTAILLKENDSPHTIPI